MKEAVETVVAEKPKSGKVKEGTKPETAVDGAAVEKKKSVKLASNTKYRILSGVDAAKFRGQRQIVVKALQSLGEGFFTLEQIAAKCDGLISKTPVEASAKYHLGGLVADKEVETLTEAPAAATETAVEKAA